LVKKFAEVIQNPIKAFGLLIDNSLNMNANMIEINLKKLNLD
jgi:DNA mismatch repair ATPase MutL